MQTRHRTLLLAAGIVSLAACSTPQAPEAWQKGDLARPSMRMDSDPLEARFTAHTYFSKEAASGGTGVGGGGCGCN
jgi:hypothetical protein